MTIDEIKAKIEEFGQQAQAINNQLVAQSPDIQAVLGQIRGLELVLSSMESAGGNATTDMDMAPKFKKGIDSTRQIEKKVG